jgi:hypothetical protein
MAHKRIAFGGSLFFYCRALTTPPYRIPQGVTAPRCLRPTAVSIVETSPLSSAFTCGYLLRSVRLHRLLSNNKIFLNFAGYLFFIATL